ncbi:MAG TPA: TonB family protein [Terriglobales bacterium]|jgi:TonB family protein|nr:TonB family protein [Terriglobales bacterium]
MSAATALALETTPQRNFPRYPINVRVDLIALRSGVPENLPGRCTDISEVGVGAVVAGQMAAGQQVAVELRLPNVGVPVRARALVRYQSRLRCGLEFVGLSVEQREMIRYWVYRAASQAVDSREKTGGAAKTEVPVVVARLAAPTKRRIRIGRRGFLGLIVCMLALAGLGWWQWQRSWNELEKRLPVGEEGLRVSPETMEKRIVTEVEPVYPEAARTARLEGLVVLDAVIAPDGSVKRLQFVSGPDLLVQSATEAVRAWKFEPYVDQSRGKAVEVETTIAVEFRLH